MTYEQFWFDDPWICVPYREAHYLHIQQRNEELWLQGLYNHNAVSVAINNAFSNHKLKYIQKPLEIVKPTEAEEKKRIELIRKKLVEQLNAFKDEFERKQRTSI